MVVFIFKQHPETFLILRILEFFVRERNIERNIEIYILLNKWYNVVNIYTKSVRIKSYNMHIIGGLHVIFGDTDIKFKFGF